MKIAVIGGSGYLGTHVTKYFDADSFSRRNGFDITKNLDGMFDDYDVIIHMGAVVDKTERDVEKVFDINAEGTRNLARSLEAHQTLIFSSTKEVYTPDKDSYSSSKLIAESCIRYYAQRNGFRSGIFRLASVYAPKTNGSSFVNFFIDSIKNGKELSLLMEGAQMRDFLHVDDLSRAFEKFIGSDIRSATYDIGGGKDNSTTILGLAKKIGEITGEEPIVRFSNNPIKGDPHWVTDISRVSEELSWKPKISIEEGLVRIS